MLPSHSLPDLGARGKGKGRARSRGKPPRRGSGGRVLAGIAEVAWEAEYKDAAVRDSPAAVTAYKGPRSLLGSKRGNYNRPGTAPMAMSSSNDGGDGGVDGYDPQVPKRSALYEINDLRALMSSNPALLRQDDTQKSMAQLQRQTKAYRQTKRIDPDRGKWKRKPLQPNPVVWYYTSRNVISSFEIEQLPAQDIDRSQRKHVPATYLAGPIRSFSVENHIKERACLDLLHAKTLADKADDFPGPGHYGMPKPLGKDVKGGYMSTADYGDRLRMPDASGASKAELLYQKMGEMARSSSSNKKFNCISHQPFMLPAQPLKKGQVDIIKRNKSESHLWTKTGRAQRIKKNAALKEQRLDRVQAQAEERYHAFIAAKKQSIQKYDTSHRLYMKQRREAAKNKRSQLKNWLLLIEHFSRVVAIKKFLGLQGDLNKKKAACRQILAYWREYKSRLRRRNFTNTSCMVDVFVRQRVRKIREKADMEVKQTQMAKIIEFMRNIPSYKNQALRTAADNLVSKTVQIQRNWRSYLVTRKWRLWTLLCQLERFRDGHMWTQAAEKIESFKADRAERLRQTALREKKKAAAAGKKGNKYAPPAREPDSPWLVDFLELDDEDREGAIARLCSVYKSNSKRKIRQVPKELHLDNHYSHAQWRTQVEYDVAQELLDARTRKFKDNLRAYTAMLGKVVQDHSSAQQVKKDRQEHHNSTLTSIPEALLGEEEKRMLASRGMRRNEDALSQEELELKLQKLEHRRPWFHNKYDRGALTSMFHVVFVRLHAMALEEHRLKKLNLPGPVTTKGGRSLQSEAAVSEMVAAHMQEMDAKRAGLASRGEVGSPPDGATRPGNNNLAQTRQKAMLRTREGVRAQVIR